MTRIIPLAALFIACTQAVWAFGASAELPNFTFAERKPAAATEAVVTRDCTLQGCTQQDTPSQDDE